MAKRSQASSSRIARKMENRNRPKTVNVKCASDVHINDTPKLKKEEILLEEA